MQLLQYLFSNRFQFIFGPHFLKISGAYFLRNRHYSALIELVRLIFRGLRLIFNDIILRLFWSFVLEEVLEGIILFGRFDVFGVLLDVLKLCLLLLTKLVEVGEIKLAYVIAALWQEMDGVERVIDAMVLIFSSLFIEDSIGTSMRSRKHSRDT